MESIQQMSFKLNKNFNSEAKNGNLIFQNRSYDLNIAMRMRKSIKFKMQV